MVTIGDVRKLIIAELYKDRSLTYGSISKATGLTVSAIYRLINGDRRPNARNQGVRFDTILKVFQALGIPFSTLDTIAEHKKLEVKYENVSFAELPRGRE